MPEESSAIFVRHFFPTATHRINPTPDETEFVGCAPGRYHQFRLNGVQSKYERETFMAN